MTAPFLFGTEFYTKGITRSNENQGIAVTPSDSVDLPSPCGSLAVTGAGNVAVNLASGGTALLSGLSAGQTVVVVVSRVLATNTTATGIFALYPAGSN